MSTDLRNGEPFEATPETPEKKKRAPRAKVRKHLLTTAFTNDVAKKLDTLVSAGHTVVSISRSTDVRGFDIISYSEE